MSDTARVLVVANRTADSDELHAALLERQAQGSISVTLLAPVHWEVTDPHGGRQATLRRLRAATDRLREAGIEPRTSSAIPTRSRRSKRSGTPSSSMK